MVKILWVGLVKRELWDDKTEHGKNISNVWIEVQTLIFVFLRVWSAYNPVSAYKIHLPKRSHGSSPSRLFLCIQVPAGAPIFNVGETGDFLSFGSRMLGFFSRGLFVGWRAWKDKGCDFFGERFGAKERWWISLVLGERFGALESSKSQGRYTLED